VPICFLDLVGLERSTGIDEPLVSKIIHYHFEEFTVDRLISYLSKLYLEFDLEVNIT
jgi:hypothetical protein